MLNLHFTIPILAYTALILVLNWLRWKYFGWIAVSLNGITIRYNSLSWCCLWYSCVTCCINIYSECDKPTIMWRYSFFPSIVMCIKYSGKHQEFTSLNSLHDNVPSIEFGIGYDWYHHSNTGWHAGFNFCRSFCWIYTVHTKTYLKYLKALQ